MYLWYSVIVCLYHSLHLHQ